MAETKQPPKDAKQRQPSQATRRSPTTEPPWNVVLHNDWDNAFTSVILKLKKAMLGMTLARATTITYRAHASGKATVKRCHKELAEMHQEHLRAENLSVTLEPAE